MPVFRQFPKGSVIGSGAYVFRHYGSEAPVMRNYLCFTAEEENSTVGMLVEGIPTQGQAFETSTDGNTWAAFTPGTTVITLANIGDKVYFRGDNTTVSEFTNIYHKFVMTGLIAGSGNIMSLLDKTCESVAITNAFCFAYMFRDCTSLTTAPELPATTLGTYCYSYMFFGCSSLTTAPELPATTLKDYCYQRMLQGCSSLTTAPELPATTLTDSCYSNMFRVCTSLTTAPELPATTLGTSCYGYMFYGCTSLTTAPELPAITMKTYCYRNMFQGCSSLKISSTKTGAYQYSWRIPTSGTGATASSWNLNMLASTGGTFTSNPTINKTYYTDHAPV